MTSTRTFQIGDRVVKNLATWKANSSDEWGRGLGVGIVVEPPFFMEEFGADVGWPYGRCFEFVDGLRLAPDPFEYAVLEHIAEDFESRATIIGDLGRALHREVIERELDAALVSLVEQGFAQAFVFNRHSLAYALLGMEQLKACAEPWFHASEAGKACIIAVDDAA